MTRAEFAAIVVRLVGGDNVADGHDFSDITGCWAEQEIAIAASLGWILGYEDGTFRPDRSITRAEAVTIINRILGRLEYDPAELGANLKTFTDNTPGLWYYEAIQEAANGTLPDLGEHA